MVDLCLQRVEATNHHPGIDNHQPITNQGSPINNWIYLIAYVPSGVCTRCALWHVAQLPPIVVEAATRLS
jgi:hypothetical protein